MKTLKYALVLVVAAALVSCTANQSVRHYGGSITTDLPTGEKLVTVTWKDNDLWYLTRRAKAGEVPETLVFKEDSNYGMWSGTIVFKEH